VRADLEDGLVLIGFAAVAAAMVECWAAFRLTRALGRTR